MNIDDSMDSQAFIRQRRNLLVTSLLLTFTFVTGLTFNNFNFLGANGELAKKVSIDAYLGIALLYFVWRYWQAFKGLTRPTTKARYIKIKKTYLERLAKKKLLAHFDGQELSYSNPARGTGQMEPDFWMPHEGEESGIRGIVVKMNSNITSDPHTGTKNADVPLTRWEFRRCQWAAISSLCFTSNEISEYYLPYAIALIPFGVYAWQAIYTC